MAKKAKKTGKRRRVSGISKSGSTKVLAAVGGGIAAQLIIKTISTMPSIPATFKGAIPVVIGLIAQKSKSEAMRSLGLGALVVGGVQLVRDNSGGMLGMVRPGFNTSQNPRGSVTGMRKVAGMPAHAAAILE